MNMMICISIVECFGCIFGCGWCVYVCGEWWVLNWLVVKGVFLVGVIVLLWVVKLVVLGVLFYVVFWFVFVLLGVVVVGCVVVVNILEEDEWLFIDFIELCKIFGYDFNLYNDMLYELYIDD